MGVAFGASFYGYALVIRNSENLTTLSSILAKTLSEVQLHGVAQGSVELDPKELPLSPGAIIALSSDSRLILDPKARVNADGELKIQMPPAMSSFTNSTVPTNRRTSAQPIVNFTIFKTMAFDKGSVMTGWKFLTSAQRAPTEQYCYYTEDAATPDVNVVVDLGENGKMNTPQDVPKEFDINSAFKRCVWFKAAEP
jgi:hypothetical protein